MKKFLAESWKTIFLVFLAVVGAILEVAIGIFDLLGLGQ